MNFAQVQHGFRKWVPAKRLTDTIELRRISFNSLRVAWIQHKELLKSYLPSGLHAFPDTKVTDDPGQQKTQSQLPSNAAQLMNASREIKNSSPENQLLCHYLYMLKTLWELVSYFDLLFKLTPKTLSLVTLHFQQLSSSHNQLCDQTPHRCLLKRNTRCSKQRIEGQLHTLYHSAFGNFIFYTYLTWKTEWGTFPDMQYQLLLKWKAIEPHGCILVCRLGWIKQCFFCNCSW